MTIDSTQIAVERAIPYQEFKKNPHTVCLTTSLGGHLAFFEIGGGRWHAKPVYCARIEDLLRGSRPANNFRCPIS